jgi:leucyl aminopeptidase
MYTVADNTYVHTAQNTIGKANVAYMVEYARRVVGFVVELAFAAL